MNRLWRGGTREAKWNSSSGTNEIVERVEVRERETKEDCWKGKNMFKEFDIPTKKYFFRSKI